MRDENLKYYSDLEGDVLNKLMKTRGVDDVQALLNVSREDEIHWSKLPNAEYCADIIMEYCESDDDKVISILADDDVDGVTSTVEMAGHIKDTYGIECKILIHGDENKHGVHCDELFNGKENEEIIEQTDLLIIVDAGSSDIKEMILLKEKKPNLEILVIDHHPLEDAIKYDTIPDFRELYNNEEKWIVELDGEEVKYPADCLVNNQVGDYPNKTLVGGAVVYKVLQCIDEALYQAKSDYYLPHVALALIGDRADLTNLETRYLVNKGIEVINGYEELYHDGLEDEIPSLFFKWLIKHLNSYRKTPITINSVGWNVAPIINAFARIGNYEEHSLLFRAMLDLEETKIYQGRKSKGVKPPPEIRPIQQEAIRIGNNLRSKQNNWAKKITAEAEKIIESKNLSDNQVMLIDVVKHFDKPLKWKLSGLIASQISEKYFKPTMIMKKINQDGNLDGSMRCFNNAPVLDFRNDLNTHTNIIARGHASASGVEAPLNYDKDIEKLNELYEDYDMSPVYFVDFIARFNRIQASDVMEIANSNHLFGGNLPKPRILVKAVIDTTDNNVVRLFGVRKNVLNIRGTQGYNPRTGTGDESKCVDMVMLRQGEAHLNKMKGINSAFATKSWRKIELEAVCEPSINYYKGQRLPQLKIIDYRTKEYKEREIDF